MGCGGFWPDVVVGARLIMVTRVGLTKMMERDASL